MKKVCITYLLLGIALIASGCAQKIQIYDTEINSKPPGAKVNVDGQDLPQPTPVNHTFDFKANKEYRLVLTKDGYFQNEVLVDEKYPSLATDGEVVIKLEPSPLWAATTTSPATNNWIQILISNNLTAKVAWQLVIDDVVKRSINIKEINYEAGYLQTKFTVKKFDTPNGEFYLRCQMILTLVSPEPLIYRVKDIAEWSANGIKWHPYNRIFIKHAEMIQEIQDRLRSY